MIYETTDNRWSVIYARAINHDGSLYFPERLSKEFLDETRKSQGSYLFANQYLNEVIPSDKQVFKKEWFRYYHTIPRNHFTFIVVDPAISTSDDADFTGIVVVSVDENNQKYLRQAMRLKAHPGEIIDKLFELNLEHNPIAIGVETVAFQKVLIYLIHQEMIKRGVTLPIKEITPPNDRSKEMRILGLVPWFEWGNILINQGLHDFELELMQFPRGIHDDIIDALAHTNELIFTPSPEKPSDITNPHDPSYEKKIIEKLVKKANQGMY